MQVGAPGAAEAYVTRPVGLPLEIVPEKSPYDLAPNERLPVQVLYEGHPLAGATVTLEPR